MAGHGVDAEPCGTHHTRRTAESTERHSSQEPFPPPSSAQRAAGQARLVGHATTATGLCASGPPRSRVAFAAQGPGTTERNLTPPPPERPSFSLPSGPRSRDPAQKAAGVPRHRQLRSKRSAADKVEAAEGPPLVVSYRDDVRPRTPAGRPQLHEAAPTHYVCTYTLYVRAWMHEDRPRQAGRSSQRPELDRYLGMKLGVGRCAYAHLLHARSGERQACCPFGLGELLGGCGSSEWCGATGCRAVSVQLSCRARTEEGAPGIVRAST